MLCLGFAPLRLACLWLSQAATLALRFWAGFLNNSTSRWEPILESWEASAELVELCSPIFRSDHQRCVRPLRLQFFVPELRIQCD